MTRKDRRSRLSPDKEKELAALLGRIESAVGLDTAALNEIPMPPSAAESILIGGAQAAMIALFNVLKRYGLKDRFKAKQATAKTMTIIAQLIHTAYLAAAREYGAHCSWPPEPPSICDGDDLT